MAARSFKDLIVWQKSYQVSLITYEVTKEFPKSELFSLTNQMRRSSASITANLAEGFGRHGYKEKLQFYFQAHGSLTELKDQMYIARDVDYINLKDFDITMLLLTQTQQLLLALIKKTKTFIK
jgi:four helix bundle protein